MANETNGCAGCLLTCVIIYVIGCVAYFLYTTIGGEVLTIVFALIFVGCLKFLSGK